MCPPFRPALTISPPVWVAKSWDTSIRVRTCYISNLPNTYANPGLWAKPDIGYPDAPVDAGIADLIVALNTAGHHTTFCCSGLEEDHEGGADERGRSGYICFETDITVLGALLVAPLYLDGPTTIRSRFHASDAALRAAWDTLLAKLSQL